MRHENFGRGQKAAGRDGRIGGSAGTSLCVSLLMRIGGNLSTGESSGRRALGRFIREQTVVGQGGAPAAKRGRTTLTLGRLGATAERESAHLDFELGRSVLGSVGDFECWLSSVPNFVWRKLRAECEGSTDAVFRPRADASRAVGPRRQVAPVRVPASLSGSGR